MVSKATGALKQTSNRLDNIFTSKQGAVDVRFN